MTFPETLMPPSPTDGARELLAYVAVTVFVYVLGVCLLAALFHVAPL